MTPARLTTIEETIYGGRLARDLDVSERTVRRWCAGTSAIPDGIKNDLAQICRARAKMLAKLAITLSQEA
jgi:hypothetical protein